MSQQREQPTNEPSLLLTKEENEMVFAALGSRRIVSKYFINIKPQNYPRICVIIDESHCSGATLYCQSGSSEMDQTEDWSCVFCKGQLEEILLH